MARWIHLSVSYDQPGVTRDAIDVGLGHVGLGPPSPWPASVARRVTDELITASA